MLKYQEEEEYVNRCWIGSGTNNFRSSFQHQGHNKLSVWNEWQQVDDISSCPMPNVHMGKGS